MRVIVELRRTACGVEGVLIRDGSDRHVPFYGWLELFRLLEELEAPPETGARPG